MVAAVERYSGQKKIKLMWASDDKKLWILVDFKAYNV